MRSHLEETAHQVASGDDSRGTQDLRARTAANFFTSKYLQAPPCVGRMGAGTPSPEPGARMRQVCWGCRGQAERPTRPS